MSIKIISILLNKNQQNSFYLHENKTIAMKEKKFRFLKITYFGASDNPNDDVNPYDDLDTFGKATVGSLGWGIDDGVRKRSKLRFAHNYYHVLRHYGVLLTIEDILENLVDDLSNDEVVEKWLEAAVFN